MAKQLRRVVVTGMGAVTPIGLSVDEFWEGMMNSQSGAATITAFDPSPFETQFACELKDFDPSDLVDRKMARRVDKFCLYGLAVAEQALRDADLDPESMSEEEKERTSIECNGSGVGSLELIRVVEEL